MLTIQGIQHITARTVTFNKGLTIENHLVKKKMMKSSNKRRKKITKKLY